MTKLNSTFFVVLGLAIAFIFYWRECRPKPAQVPGKDSIIYKIQTVYVHDTVKVDKPFPFEVMSGGQLIKPSASDTVFLPAKPFMIDTLSVVFDYFKTRFYSDTIQTQYGTVIAKSEVTQNKLHKFKSDINLVFKDTAKTDIQPAVLKNQVYFGLGAGSNGAQITLGPAFLIRTKREHIYEASGGWTPGISSNAWRVDVKTFWKIHL